MAIHEAKEASASNKNKKDAKKEEAHKIGNTGLITLDEFKFPHAIYMYDDHRSIKADSLTAGYSKCAS